MLKADGISISFAGRPVLEDISLDVGAGQSLAIVGPSGAGKTTLLYSLCGLTRPDAGSIRLDDGPARHGPGEVGIILQDYGLLPWKNVLDNVALGLKIAGVPKKERKRRAREQLAEVGLAGRETDYPARLSGGEQQRVAIARAFAGRPKVLLLDEPFSSLDAITREKLQATLLSLWQRRGTPYVLVTHSVEEAVFLGARVLLLSGRPARVRKVFDNPGFGRSDHRDSQEAFCLIRNIRQAMEAYF
jgi:NitT/TauT family transport system ATP-binding protein